MTDRAVKTFKPKQHRLETPTDLGSNATKISRLSWTRSWPIPSRSSWRQRTSTGMSVVRIFVTTTCYSTSS